MPCCQSSLQAGSIVPIGLPFGSGAGGGAGGADGCGIPFMKTRRDASSSSTEQFYGCGDCKFMEFNSPAYLGDGTYVEQKESGGYKLYRSDGTEIQFSAPTPEDGPLSYSYAESMEDAQGRETTFTRDSNGAIEEVTLPNGETWLYEHGPCDAKITKVKAPDGVTSAEISYVQSGWAAEKVQSVKLYTGATLTQEANYTYQEDGRLQEATAGASSATYQYNDTNGTITVTETSASPQKVTVYAYDSAGPNTTTVTRKHASNPNLDQVTTYEFESWLIDGRKYIKEITDSFGNTTIYDWYTSGEFAGRIYRVTDALGRQTNTEYYPTNETNGYVLVKRVTLPEVGGKTYYTEYTYARDAGNNVQPYAETVVRCEKEGENVTTYGATKYIYNADWTVQEVKDGPDLDHLSTAQQFTYYTSGGRKAMLKDETVPGVGGGDMVTAYDYTDTGDKVRTSPTLITYKWFNPATSQYEDVSINHHYDDLSRLISETDARSNTTTTDYSYQDGQRVVTTTFPLTPPDSTQKTRVEKYGCCGLSEAKDENDNYTYYGYSAGRLSKMWTNFDGQSSDTPLVTYGYDEFGNTARVTSYKDALTGRETIYTYDKLNRVVETYHPGGLSTERFQYNAVGSLRAKMDGSGAVTVYEYDTLNRVSKVQYNYTGDWPVPDEFTIGTPDVTYTYRYNTGLVKTMVDSTGATSYDYDHRGRLIGYTPPVPSGYGTVEYAYDNANNKTSATMPDITVGYEYFKNGWLKLLSDNVADISIGYQYDKTGNRTQIVRGAQNSSGFEYDPRDRISGITHTVGGTPAASVAYTRDGVGSPLTAGWTNGGQPWNVGYGYDAMNRLTSETHSLQGQRTWTYDWVGNRLDSGFVYDDPTDELVEGPAETDRLYNATGSMSQKDSVAYAYNPQELLRQVGTSTTLDWDAESRRVRLTAGSDVYQFVYDPTASIPAVVQEFGPDERNIVYVREPDGSLAARVHPSESSADYYYFDDLGSTVLMTQGLSTITDRYDYRAWGEPRVILGGTTDNPYLYVGQLGYYAHWQDPALADMLHLGVRFYEPGVGRFGQLDPIREGVNRYTYVHNRPLGTVDPSGELGIGALVGIGASAWFMLCGIDSLASLKLVALPWTPNRDKLAHCISACIIRRCGTIVQSCLWGHFKEQAWDRAFGEGPSRTDYEANNKGEWCAKQVGDTDQCDACCAKFYPVKGFRPYEPWPVR